MAESSEFSEKPLDLIAWENGELAKGVCPWSGGRLLRREYDDGPAVTSGGVLSCGICDCFGFPVPHIAAVPSTPEGDQSHD